MFFLSLVHFLWRYFFTFGNPAPSSAGVESIAVNCALFTAFAMHHSALARTGAKAWINRAVGPDRERTLYVWVASLLFFAVAGLWRPVAGVLWSLDGWAAWIAWAGQLAGVAMTVWSAGALGVMELAGLRRAPKPVSPMPGSSRSDRALRDTGPYGFVRHPIYFSWLLLVWSVPVMNGTRLSFALISTLYLVVAIPFEERSLVAHFGPAYTRYQAKVRSRMLPFVY